MVIYGNLRKKHDSDNACEVSGIENVVACDIFQ